MKEYDVSITTEITYTVRVSANDEDTAEDIARDNYVGPCIIILDGSGESYEGLIHDIWSSEDIEVINTEEE